MDEQDSYEQREQQQTEVNLDILLPWDQFLTREVIPRLSKTSTTSRITSITAINQKIAQCSALEEKYVYSIIKQLTTIITNRLEKPVWILLCGTLTALFSKHEWDDIVVRNTVKWLEKTLNINGNTSSLDPESYYFYGEYLLELLRVLLTKHHTTLDLQSSSFTSLMSMIICCITKLASCHNQKLYASLKVILFHVISGYQSSFRAKVDIDLTPSNRNVTVAFIDYTKRCITSSVASANDIFVLEGVLLSMQLFNINHDEEFMENVINFYTLVILSSKVALSRAYSISLCKFFSSHMTQTHFEGFIFPVLERLLLRSPETALQVANELMKVLNFDLGTYIGKIGDALLNQTKSFSESLRLNATSICNSMLSKSISPDQFLESYIKQFTKSPSLEQRTQLYSVLPSINTRVSKILIESFPFYLQRESNDALFTTGMVLFAPHVNAFISSVDSDLKCIEKLVEWISNGLNQSSSSRRSAYLHLVSQISSKEFMNKIELAIFKPLLEKVIILVLKVQASGIQLLDTSKKDIPLFSEGLYGLSFLQKIAYLENDDNKVHNVGALLTRTDLKVLWETPFVFEEKLYTRLCTSENEEETLLLILLQYVENNMRMKEEMLSKILLHLFIYSRHYSTRQKTYNSVNALVTSPTREIYIKALLTGLTNLLLSTKQTQSSSRSSASLAYKIYATIQSMIPKLSSSSIPDDLQVQTLLDVSVLCSHPEVAHKFGYDAWIRLCFRCNTNPETVLESRLIQLLTSWINIPDEKMSFWKGSLLEKTIFREASLNALKLFYNIMPEQVSSVIFPWIIKHIKDERIKSINYTDVQIWKTEKGKLCFDPLVKRRVGGRERDDIWEHDSKGNRKTELVSVPYDKLSKKDKELVDKQVEFEKQTRDRVGQVYEGTINVLDALNAILDSIGVQSGDRDDETSFGPFVYSLVDGLIKNLIYFYGPQDSQNSQICTEFSDVFLAAYVRIGKVLCTRVPSLLKPVPELSSATLRLNGCIEGHGAIPVYICQHTISDQLSVCLTDLKESHTPSTPFPPSQFCYIFPLLQSVIINQKVETMLKKSFIEALLLSADILLSHASLGEYDYVPSKEYIECLLQLMSIPKLTIRTREALVTFCSARTDASLTSSDISKILLRGLESPLSEVRASCLDALQYIDVKIDRVLATSVWRLKYDYGEVKEAADVLWSYMCGELTLQDKYAPQLVDVSILSVQQVAKAGAKALVDVIKSQPKHLPKTLETLYEAYKANTAPVPPKYDAYGILIKSSLEKDDDWCPRLGMAVVFNELASEMSDKKIMTEFLAFLIKSEALGDFNDQVRTLMLEAGLSCISHHGKAFTSELLTITESSLKKIEGTSDKADYIRQNTVVLTGSLAQHLPPADPKIASVIEELLKIIETPSESVQISVSQCLIPLIKLIPSRTSSLLEQCLHTLFNSPKYGSRKGAAYGIAGIVKGYGLSSLREFGLFSKLKEAAEDKKITIRREGAMFAFGSLSNSLGRVFEPYVIKILPLLLIAYGDSAKEVRAATHAASKLIMSKLSGHCVKLVLPSLLRGLEDEDSWRTKVGSVEVLGSMAFLAPKQLAISLPQIVPRLCEALTDSHHKVVDSAKVALKNFGEVIKNPEISSIVPILIDALREPDENTDTALSTLLATSFVHYIDSPSLALIIPILHRGLKQRSTNIKKKSSQIIGNMACLTDQKDLIPYLNLLMPKMREVLVDPVPIARTTTAKSLGLLVEKLGESSFPTLISELLIELKSDISGVDRFGSAQGLSEVIAGIGIHKLDELLPEILISTNSLKSYVREGFYTLLIYLPLTFGEKFISYLPPIIPVILRGLADDNDQVRAAALRIGQIAVKNYASSAIDLLLPELEKGLFDENHRIRHSSIQLMGELLNKISGINAKNAMPEEEEEDEDNVNEDEHYSIETTRHAVIEALGLAHYQSILASLYIVRSDTNARVRQASIKVWKSLVSNTPKTLKEIFPILMQSLIQFLACHSDETKGVAARTLGELVRKVGEGILEQIIPLLKKGLESEDDSSRQGVCLGITEIIHAAGKQDIEEFIIKCIPIVRVALVDSEVSVREAAAQAFDLVHQQVGPRVIDEIIPELLSQLHSSSKATNYALEGLKEIMSVRSNIVFPVLLPNLLHTPLTCLNATALGSLISVAGHALTKKLPVIVPYLINCLEQDDEAVQNIQRALETLLKTVDEDEGVHSLLQLLSGMLSDASLVRRNNALGALEYFFGHNEYDIERFYADYITRLVNLLKVVPGKVDLSTVKIAWSALSALTKRINKEDAEKYVIVTRKAVSLVISSCEQGSLIDGLCLAKGIAPLLPIYLNGLLYAGNLVREQSVLAIGELIMHSTADALKPFVIPITGPLIRIIGDRIPIEMKEAILKTMHDLLTTVAFMLKPFLPQLQRTFVKSLTDAESNKVREYAGTCLSMLIGLQPRLDPLVAELCQNIKSITDTTVQCALYDGLCRVLEALGESKTISEANQELIVAQCIDSLTSTNVDLWEKCTKCIALYSKEFGEKGFSIPTLLLKDEVVPLFVLKSFSETNIELVKGKHCVLFSATLKNFLSEEAEDLRNIVLEIARTFIEHFIQNEDMLAFLMSVLEKDSRVTVKTRVVLILQKVLSKDHAIVSSILGKLIPLLTTCARDKNATLKSAAEKALVHVLQIGKDEKVLADYVSSLSLNQGKLVVDYAKKVLSKVVMTDRE